MVCFFQGSLDGQGELLFFCPVEKEGDFRERGLGAVAVVRWEGRRCRPWEE